MEEQGLGGDAGKQLKRYSRYMVAVSQKLNLNVDPTLARACSP
jgi:hypothetical protein